MTGTVTLRAVGSSQGSKVHMPSTWAELTYAASQKILAGKPANYIRDDRGDIIHADIRLIQSGDVLYVSSDAEWKSPPLETPMLPPPQFVAPRANAAGPSDDTYMTRHGDAIESALSEAIEVLLQYKPDDPMAFIASCLVHRGLSAAEDCGSPSNSRRASAATRRNSIQAAAAAEARPPDEDAPSSRTELKALFDALDSDGDGRVSRGEWSATVAQNRQLARRYFGGARDEEVAAAFSRIDVDGSGDLTWEEFVEAARSFAVAELMADAVLSDEGKASLRALFDALDGDGDGRVDKKEWGRALGKNAALMGSYFGGATMGEIGSAFRRIDGDNSDDLSWEEFEAAARSYQLTQSFATMLATPTGRAELQSLFETLDSNGDGRVSSKEWGTTIAQNRELAARYFGGANMAQVGAAFRRIDVDGSGDLTWDEFVEAALSFAVAQKVAEAATLPAAVPVDGLWVRKSL